MRSIIIKNPGPSNTLDWENRPDPTPGTGELVIASSTTAINRADLMQRAGHYPPPEGASDVPGLEVAGTVIEVGAGCTRFKKGDRVMALLAGGGYANQSKRIRIALPGNS